MILTYYPDVDTLDVRFDIPPPSVHDAADEAVEEARGVSNVQAERRADAETHDADAAGHIQAHLREGRFDGLTIEHASRRAPADWNIDELRREAAQVAASTNRIIESVRHDVINDRKSFQTGQLGPHSAHTSDAAVREYNALVDHYREKTAAA